MRARVVYGIHEMIRGVKRTIRELLPPALDHRRLSSALGSVFRDIREVYGLTVHARLAPVDDELDAGPRWSCTGSSRRP